MNSLSVWFRSFFSWVLVVDTPPYPYESWRDLPKKQWPTGYDPITDSFPLAKASLWATGMQPAGVALIEVDNLEAELTATRDASRIAASQSKKQTARKLIYQQRFAHH